MKLSVFCLAAVLVWGCGSRTALELATSRGDVGAGASGGASGSDGVGGIASGGPAGFGAGPNAGADAGVAGRPGCGDGVIQQSEECDDGNLSSGDGCSRDCFVEERVVASAGFTCALLPARTLKCWGNNFYGRLGLGDTMSRGGDPGDMSHLPSVDLGSARHAVSLTANDQTCALLDDDSLKCWGINIVGQLGLGDLHNRGDDPHEMGDQLPRIELGSGRRAVRVAPGFSHTCALLDNGSVKCWGANVYGQLGLGDTEPRGDQPSEMGDELPAVELGSGRHAVNLIVGGDHSCALLDDGSLKCWGRNGFGQLGLGDTHNRGEHPGEMGDALPAVQLGGGRITRLTAGFEHTCALFDDGSVKCWGHNEFGSLGLGDLEIRGDDPTDMGDNLPPVALGAGRHALRIASNSEHTCALLDNNALKCWGYNGVGQLGLGDTQDHGDDPGEMGDALPAIDLGSGRHATNVYVGGFHTCAELDDHSLKCWGDNSWGELGLGDDKRRGDKPGEMGDNLPAVQF